MRGSMTKNSIYNAQISPLILIYKLPHMKSSLIKSAIQMIIREKYLSAESWLFRVKSEDFNKDFKSSSQIPFHDNCVLVSDHGDLWGAIFAAYRPLSP